VSGQHGAPDQKGREAHLNPDGTITCVCGLPITFLPATRPEAGPNSVNHVDCSLGERSEAGIETINLIDQAEVAAYYDRLEAAAAAKAAPAVP
jgi:hypothetical protein